MIEVVQPHEAPGRIAELERMQCMGSVSGSGSGSPFARKRSSGGGGVVPPDTNLEAWLPASSAQVTGTAVDTMPDDTGNGHDLVYTSGGQATFVAGGAAGYDAVHFYTMLSTIVYTLSSPIVKQDRTAGGSGTHYTVFYLAAAISSPNMPFLSGGSYYPGWGHNPIAPPNDYYHLWPGFAPQGQLATPFTTLLWARWRYAAGVSQNTVLGVGSAACASAPGDGASGTDNYTGATTSIFNFYVVDTLYYNEDTVTTGTDAGVMSYLASAYGI